MNAGEIVGLAEASAARCEKDAAEALQHAATFIPNARSRIDLIDAAIASLEAAKRLRSKVSLLQADQPA